MKERPIIFSAPMVRAILDGRKTQTRRIVKPQPEYIANSGRWRWPLPKRLAASRGPYVYTASREWWEYLRDDGFPVRPGDVLWVRETWGIGGDGYEIDPTLNFKADGSQRVLDPTLNHMRSEVERCFGRGWRSPIHMPRWASRLRLLVKSVRVERLQDISYDDCESEGIEAAMAGDGSTIYAATAEIHSSCPVEAFCLLWESIHGTESWDRNPWVWVYEFGLPK